MSLRAPYDEANVFARILRGEVPAAVVHEDALALTIMDAFPQSFGHCLVIPKAQARTLADLAPELAGPVFARVQQVAKAVIAALEPDGVAVMQFNGAPAGQTVFHLHVHVIPRYLAHLQQKSSRGFVPENADIQPFGASNPTKSGSDSVDDALGAELKGHGQAGAADMAALQACAARIAARLELKS